MNVEMINCKTWALVVMICFAAFPGHAQKSDFKPYFSFGTAHGAVLSSVNFYPNKVQNSFLGYIGGISGSYTSEQDFALQIEINYSQRGWKELINSVAYTRRLNYIEIPFLTHLYLGNSFRWILDLGPKIGFLIGNQKPPYTDALAGNPEYTLPISNTFDYGICAGTGFELYTKPMSYTLEVRYSFGLSDIFPNAKKDVFQSSGNMFWSLTLGVQLHFWR